MRDCTFVMTEPSEPGFREPPPVENRRENRCEADVKTDKRQPCIFRKSYVL